MLRRFSRDNAEHEVNVEQVADAIVEETHTLLDVREQDEWDDAHISESIHIPLADLASRAGELPEDKPIYTICHSGARSLYAIPILERAGLHGAKSLADGIVAWAQAGKPLAR